MKTYGFLMIIPALLLNGCVQWERNDASNTLWQAEYAKCKERAYQRFPPDVVKDVEVEYGDQYVPCKKNKKTCPDGHRYESRPTLRTLHSDNNKDARNAIIKSCMYEKGWYEKVYYWPRS
ncbi:hypothetical protein PJX95_16310 [Serratia rubidaea]|uniref:Lipoprotein n=2 Tax=Serratia rubidaea TaxID=61652 RepID=A0ABS0MBC5_SERRU|nr:hypothetical protein [Serratia rubidaea]MBH1928702.1 hypothetical protein [Serratia rubidaea]MDC6119615.1 hypothetical protein [Serratia rubidaea]MEB7584497.1 hypothetical protein [Serratia rubidaea]